MKFVLLSDAHLCNDKPVARLDNCKEAGYDKLRYVIMWANKNNAIILQAGDLCHKPRSWELLADMLDIMNIYTPGFFGVYGQHDTYLYNEDARRKTILGALEASDCIKVLNAKPVYIGDYALYGCSYGQEIPEVVDKGENAPWAILVIHAPISDEELWKGQDYWDAKAFLEKHGRYKIILCGDIHNKFCIPNVAAAFGNEHARYIVNAGPMVRREATEYNMVHKPGFWVWDDSRQKMSWVEIPHAPAKNVLSRDHIEAPADAKLILQDFIDSVKVQAEEGVDFMTNLRRFINENKLEGRVYDIIAEVIGDERMSREG